MGVRAGESNKLFGYNTNYDLSSNTLLELKVTNPLGVEIAILSTRITAPAVLGVFDEGGVDATYNANEYMQFTVLASDFDLSGTWHVEGRYTNTTTTPDQIYHGDKKPFVVGEDF